MPGGLAGRQGFEALVAGQGGGVEQNGAVSPGVADRIFQLPLVGLALLLPVALAEKDESRRAAAAFSSITLVAKGRAVACCSRSTGVQSHIGRHTLPGEWPLFACAAMATALVARASVLPRSGRRRSCMLRTSRRSFHRGNIRQVYRYKSLIGLSASGEAETLSKVAPTHAGSRMVAVVGRDGVGKSKVCAALLELGEPLATQAAVETPSFADKTRLLEHESAEDRRNFSCYNHVYSQRMGQARLHLIDTPGHIDRMPLVDNALEKVHGAVIVCSVQCGVDHACGRIFAAVEQAGKPAILFLNGIDKADDADAFDSALDALEKRLGLRPVVLFAPAHVGGAETGSRLLNVLDGTICSASGCSLEEVDNGDKAPGVLGDWAKRLRGQQIESLAAIDEQMLDAFVEFEGDVPRVMIQDALHRAVATGKVMPLVAGSARTGLGVDALQEVVHDLIPAGDGSKLLQAAIGQYPKAGMAFSSRAPFVGLAVGQQRHSDDHLVQVRVLDGKIKIGTHVKAVSRDGVVETFLLSKMFGFGVRGEVMPLFYPANCGDLVLFPVSDGIMAAASAGGLAFAEEKVIFHRASDADAMANGKDAEVLLHSHSTYKVNFSALSKKDQASLLHALRTIAQDNIEGLIFEENKASGACFLTCLGQLHLELLRERLAEEFNVLHLPLGRPFIAYQSTLKGPSQATGKHEPDGKSRIRKGILHTHHQKADASIKVELLPADAGSGVVIEQDAHTKVDKAIEEGIRGALKEGGPGGVPVTDVHVRVTAAEANKEDAAKVAAESAVHHAIEHAPRHLLEPIISIEVMVPSSVVDKVIEDLEKHRRAEVWGARDSEEDEGKVVDAEMPLRELRDYETELRKLTGGQGSFTYKLQGYREVSLQLERQIIEEELKVA